METTTVRRGAPPVETLTLRQLNRATLARQMLLGRADIGPVEAVRRLAGLQAQEPKPPFLGLWTRVAGFAAADLTGALHRRELVRAPAMRATLHLLAAADYPVVRPAVQPVMYQAVRVLGDRAEGLEPDEVLPAARDLLAEQPRTFDELRGLLAEAFPGVDERALGYTVRLHLPLVMVPTRDRWAFPSNARFALADGWLEGTAGDSGSATDGDEVGALVLSYLGAFGPASVADVQTWSGLGGLKGVVEGLRPKLAVFADARGRELFDLPDAPRPDARVPAPPRFLPEFDNLVLAHADRTRIVPDEHRGQVVTRNLRVRATFLWNGFVAGTWKAQRRRKAATLQLTPFAELSATAVRGLTREGEALLRFTDPDADTFAVEVGEPA